MVESRKFIMAKPPTIYSSSHTDTSQVNDVLKLKTLLADQIRTSNSFVRSDPQTINTNSDVIYAPSQILCGILTRDPNGAARNDSLPTASDLLGVFVSKNANDYFYLQIDNSSVSYTVTIVGNTGVTVENEIIIFPSQSITLVFLISDITPGSESIKVYCRGAPVAPTFIGATESTPGTTGLVPAPSAGQQNMFLRGDATFALAGFRNVQVFTTDGIYTPTAGTSRALVYVTGGGGAGGGANGTPNNSCGSGGNSGNTLVVLFAIDDPSLTATCTIGLGGTGVLGGTGGNGSSSTFVYNSVTLNAIGGAGGSVKTGSNNWWVVPPNNPISSQIVPPLSIAVLSAYAILSTYGNPGITVDADYVQGGYGGSSIYGGGGDGANIMGPATNFNGNPGKPNTGSGGGGAGKTNNNSATGGEGSSGIIMIYEY